MDNGEMTLPQHEAASAMRADKLMAKIDEIKGDAKMGAPVNVFTPAATDGGMAAAVPAIMAASMGGGTGHAGAAIGGGLGAGLLGGLLGGVLFGGRGGLLGAAAVDGAACVTPTQLTAGLAGVTEALQNTNVMQVLGDIKGSIPLAEGQVQLAIAGAQSDLTNLINTANVANLQGQFAINKNVSDTTAQIIAAEVATQVAVGNAVTSGLQNTFALSNLVRDDGDKTRALIIAQNDTMLNRQLAVAEAALLEERTRGRSRETEINVTQTVNQNQLQLQAQQQQQQQLILLSQIAAGLANVTQIAHATNSNVIAGNTGAVTTGAQTASPVNVNA